MLECQCELAKSANRDTAFFDCFRYGSLIPRRHERKMNIGGRCEFIGNEGGALTIPFSPHDARASLATPRSADAWETRRQDAAAVGRRRGPADRPGDDARWSSQWRELRQGRPPDAPSSSGVDMTEGMELPTDAGPPFDESAVRNKGPSGAPASPCEQTLATQLRRTGV